ncbi:MAG: tetratricopeptide repeat protein [Bacteroidetes bacterium]|nr:tetratricopeptide repeat protein [Bacteroidota bacterium]
MNATHAKALEAYENKNFEQAIPLLRDAAEETADPALRERLLIKCGVALDDLGRHAEALETLKEVLEINGDSAAAWNNLGIVCQHIGKLDEARAAFERAYRLNPEQADPLINLGSVCLRQSDPGNALQYLQLAVELLPGHPAVHANLALTYAVFGRLEEAEDALRLAILYGFEQAPVIEEKINAMKKVREEIIAQVQLRASAENAAPGEETGEDGDDASVQPQASAGEMELLVQLENEMYSLAERRFAAEPAAGAEERARLTARMDALRPQIRLLRRTLGMEEITESDTVMGINYMRDDNGNRG